MMKVVSPKTLFDIINVMEKFSLEVMYDNGVFYTISGDMVSFLKFDAKNFLEDVIEKKFLINLSQFKQLLKRFQKSTSLFIELNDNTLTLKDDRKRYQMKIIEKDSGKKDIESNIKYANQPVVIDGDYLNEAISDVLVFTDSAVFTSEDNKLVIYSNSDLQSYRTEKEVIKTSLPEFKVKFSLPYLKNIMSVIKGSDVEVYLQTDLPIKIKKGEFVYIQAPMMMEE